MGERTLKDWMMLLGGFHFFMAIIALIAAAAIFIYAVLPPIDSGLPGLPQALFIPVLGVIISLIVSGVYIMVGFGIIQFRNIARMISIFMAAFGILGGFIAVMGAIASRIIGAANPDWISILIVSLAIIIFYCLISFMNIFLLIFLFLPQVRLVFYEGDLEKVNEAGISTWDKESQLPKEEAQKGEIEPLANSR